MKIITTNWIKDQYGVDYFDVRCPYCSYPLDDSSCYIPRIQEWKPVDAEVVCPACKNKLRLKVGV